MPRGAGVPTKPPKPVPTQNAALKPNVPSTGLFSRNALPPKPPVNPVPVRYDSGVGPDYTLQTVHQNRTGDSRHENRPVRPPPVHTMSSQSASRGSGLDETTMNALSQLKLGGTQSSASSIHSQDPSDTYSKDSNSIYSFSSSAYSKAPSICSTEDFGVDQCMPSPLIPDTKITETNTTIISHSSSGVQYQESVHSVAVQRRMDPPQDDASRERSTLAKKAALFQNSRLPPQLPVFNASLLQWSMICRAAQAADDCYGPEKQIRRGTYTAANTSKNTKAMIIDEQTIDGSRFIIVAIRGTAFKSLADWSTNKAGNLTRPTSFLDDEENTCHEGFLQVSRAMIEIVAAQLQDLPAMAEKPSLLFTGHSAGGAVATMLYFHMLSKVVSSDLTVLSSHFSSINCITFGAPPVSLNAFASPESSRGIFLTFANEGDPIARISNAAYVKSLVQLMTASTSVAPPTTTKVYRSRGSAAVYKPAPAVPWEELPLWQTPAASLLLAGNIVLLRDGKTGVAEASAVTCDDLKDVIFGDLGQHSCNMYIRRVKEVALSAMTGMTME